MIKEVTDMNGFRIEIASVPDKENLVAEIWYSERLIAEVSNERSQTETELFIDSDLILDFDDFVEILHITKKRLFNYCLSWPIC